MPNSDIIRKPFTQIRTVPDFRSLAKVHGRFWHGEGSGRTYSCAVTERNAFVGAKDLSRHIL
jgi:hypothetical protein